MARQLKVRGFDKKTMAKAMKASAAGERQPLTEGEQTMLEQQEKIDNGDESKTLTPVEEAILTHGQAGTERKLTPEEEALLQSQESGGKRELTEVEQLMLDEQQAATDAAAAGAAGEGTDKDLEPLEDEEQDGDGIDLGDDVMHCLISQDKVPGMVNHYYPVTGDPTGVGTRHCPADGHWFEKVTVKVDGSFVDVWRYEGQQK